MSGSLGSRWQGFNSLLCTVFRFDARLRLRALGFIWGSQSAQTSLQALGNPREVCESRRPCCSQAHQQQSVQMKLSSQKSPLREATLNRAANASAIFGLLFWSGMWNLWPICEQTQWGKTSFLKASCATT